MEEKEKDNVKTFVNKLNTSVETPLLAELPSLSPAVNAGSFQLGRVPGGGGGGGYSYT